MKHLLALTLALLCTTALATNKPAPAPGSTAAASAQAGATSDSHALYALPGHGSPSYAGNYSICVNGRGYVWGFTWSWSPDLECVRLLAELERLRATPVPRPAVEILTTGPVTKDAANLQQVCTPLARKTKLGAGCMK